MKGSIAFDETMHEVAPTLRILVAGLDVEFRAVVRRSPWMFALLFAGLAAAFAVGVAGRHALATGIAGQVLFLGAILLGLLPMSGIVTDDVSNGTMVFWMQKGGSVRRFYLEGVVRRQIALMGVSVVVVSLLALLVPVGVLEWVMFRRFALFLPIVVLLNSSIVFAFSALGVTRDSVVAIVWIIGSVVFESRFVHMAGFGPNIVRLLSYPFDGFAEILGTGGHAAGMPPAALWLLGHFAAWIALGAWAVDRTARRSL